MVKFFRQTWALTRKTLLIAAVRFKFTTWIRAFLLPVAFMAFISYARYLLIPHSEYGVGTPAPVINLADAIGPNLKLVLISNGLGGDIARVVGNIEKAVNGSGKVVQVFPTDADLSRECRQTLRGSSLCYAAAVFYSSPGNPQNGDPKWNYTLRGDTFLGATFDVRRHDNDVQKRLLPLQHAIDWAIAEESREKENAVPKEYIYTHLSNEERQKQIQRGYQKTIINVLAVAFLISIIGITYQLVGFMAMERETGISQLVQAMGGKGIGLARLLSYHLAYDIIFAPGWVVMGLILGSVFANTSRATLVIFHLLAGLSFSSMSVFGGSFFKKAQLSGITVTIVALVLGIVGQIFHQKIGNGTVAILGILVPPMNYLWFIIWIARFESVDKAANLLKSAPQNPWNMPGIVFWIFFIVHIISFPLLAFLVEKWLYGVTEKSRIKGTANKDNAVEIRSFTKRYVPRALERKKETVVAVNGLNLNIRKGSVVGLLGANGSGKTTTIESVVGLAKITEGTIAVDVGKGGSIGVCPQKNVLWDVLTVEEHVRIWNKIKFDGDDKGTLRQLIKDCDLEPKRKAQAKTLSGGQKRKLQLAIMFTGGSTVCAIDEVSSGLDPLSRRKIWDIILAQRGRCTIILTTHFLDEADLLSDHIAILSKGHLKAEGSSVELKAKLGGGYRVTVTGGANAPSFPSLSAKEDRAYDQTVYTVPDSGSAGALVNMLEQHGIYEYDVSGPTIEDVFLRVAQDSLIEAYGPSGLPVIDEKEGVKLYPGKRLGVLMQAWWMFRKRVTIVRRNYLPTLAAVTIPIIASGLTMLLLKKYKLAGCSREETSIPGEQEDFNLLGPKFGLKMVIGPSNRISFQRLAQLTNLFPDASNSVSSSSDSIVSQLSNLVTIVDSYTEFYNAIQTNHANYTPGGFFLGQQPGDQPVFAYGGGANFISNAGIIVQNLMDNVLFQNTPAIATSYAPFDFPWAPDQGNTFQFVVYFGLAMAAFPGFFALYPTLERLRQVRALHYSNGVRSFPLWLSYVMFDFTIVLFISVVSVIIFAGAALNAWYNLSYLFVVIFLYGLASILLAYVISLFARSQLAAFAFAAGGQAVMFLAYLIAYLNVMTYTEPANLDNVLNVVHFAMATISPMSNMIRALFVSLNVFQIDCRGKQLANYPGEIKLYGGPIVYLIAQSLVLFCVLLWWDSGADRIAGGFSVFSLSRSKAKSLDGEDQSSSIVSKENEKELKDELNRVTTTQSGTDACGDGLRLIHLTKKFGSHVAVNNVTFGIPHSTVFALLGPNGAGKTTTINMIRGDILPTVGEILVENTSVIRNRAKARSHLGVCPQFDAMDQMTVLEHLKFYARIRGIPPQHVEHNVSTVMRAVGLDPYTNRMAFVLSGGNKRKLSLAIALMGNPTVLLLDEPSSGMDAASKRVMWTTLRSVVPGRSLILTTHSMEEADALATRAGILAGKMLALGSSESLRRRYGDRYHVHLVLKSAPNTTEEEMQRAKDWIMSSGLEDVVVEEKSFLGQVRFSVSAPVVANEVIARRSMDIVEGERHRMQRGRGGLSGLFGTIERAKGVLGVEYYSVSQMGLEDIFLKIVGGSGYGEEGYGVEEKKKRWWRRS